MARTVKEWIGASDDAVPPRTVRARLFRKYGGCCYLSGARISVRDEWDLEHIKPLWAGGENRESNLAPALKAPHREKTAREAGERAKADRNHAKHFGYFPESPHKIRSRPFPKGRNSSWGRA